MKKVILIDGNNLMFRSFYATSYSGNIMRNSEGFPTNALYGLVTMLNKIVEEEKPEYIAVAFDVGKNFRKVEYDFYKAGRSATPEELKMQMPYAEKLLTAMGMKYLALEPYEADDIIGTLVKKAEEDKDFDSTIISSDKDLLQLINFETDVKLLKRDSFIRMDEKVFFEEYGIDPIKMIDLKALSGDASDNIPGVKGIGEKTALKLLVDYGSLEGVYENLENIKGAVKTKLENDKENAFISKKIATIYKDVPLDLTWDDLLYTGPNDELKDIYKELGFTSFLKKLDNNEPVKETKFKVINNKSELILEEDIAVYMEYDKENYHHAKPLVLSICDKNGIYVIPDNLINEVLETLTSKNIMTYDIKKHLYHSKIKYINDLMISSFLLGKVVKDDIASIMLEKGETVITYDQLKKEKFDLDKLYLGVATKCKFIYDNMIKDIIDMKNHELYELYTKIEIPLSYVLSSMEREGVACKKETLEELKTSIKVAIDQLTIEIHELAGEEFNISSPKQLGEILFDKLEIAKGKKNKTGYKTDASVLEKLINTHPIIEKILNYRMLSKLYSTYLEGLEHYISEKGLINPIFNQTLARTGRLSCSEPNLQNIPVREELGRQIRKAFVPKNDLLVAADYSQIELRILAHISGDETLIKAFNDGADIHKKVASDMYGKPEDEITKDERKTAKAVIFGIVYGISGFGLGGNLNITKKDADKFINKYYELYPKIKIYMDNIIAKTKETGVVTTIYNRRRIIEEIKSSNYMVAAMGERMALNTPIQGTSADIIKVAMINIFKELNSKNLKSKIILQVHDELILDVVKDELEIVKDIVVKNMESVIKLSVPLIAQINVANNWYEV